MDCVDEEVLEIEEVQEVIPTESIIEVFVPMVDGEFW